MCIRDRVSPSSIDQVVDGEAVLRVPLSVARTESRRDLVYRPVVDAEPTTIALVWSVDNENPSLDDFIGVVRGRTANSSRSARPSPEPVSYTHLDVYKRQMGEVLTWA